MVDAARSNPIGSHTATQVLTKRSGHVYVLVQTCSLPIWVVCKTQVVGALRRSCHLFTLRSQNQDPVPAKL